MRKLSILVVLFLLSFTIFAQSTRNESDYKVNLAGEPPRAASEVAPTDDATSATESQESGEAATPENPNPPRNEQYRTVGFKEIFKFIIIFIFIVIIIVLFMRILKKISSPSVQDNDEIHLISTTTLANGRLVHIVNVGSEYFLVGSTDTNVNLISKIDNEQTVNSLQLKKEELPLNTKSETFSDKLMRSLGKSKLSSADTEIKGSFSFLNKQKDKLKNMK
ncbi:MAG: flagellar biosynthetic protein FliO [Spirochaetales bacterium]|nr:flagellar biosynthetic protein FliO [Spirochaetales bacterium]